MYIIGGIEPTMIHSRRSWPNFEHGSIYMERLLRRPTLMPFMNTVWLDSFNEICIKTFNTKIMKSKNIINTDENCSICLTNNKFKLLIHNNHHGLCSCCYREYFVEKYNKKCPLCREAVDYILIYSPILLLFKEYHYFGKYY